MAAYWALKAMEAFRPHGEDVCVGEATIEDTTSRT